MQDFSNVFIATPTHICKRYCAKQFTDAIAKCYPNAYLFIASNSRGDASKYYHAASQIRQRYVYTSLHLDSSYYNQKDSIHRRIVYTVNYLRRFFLQYNFEWYWSLESDVLVEKDTLEDLLRHDVDVVTCDCYPSFFTEQEFCRVTRLTMGCTLIHRSVLEQIEFRYEPTLLAAHYDALFINDCVERKINAYYDPAIKVTHMHSASGQRGWQELPSMELK